MAFFSRPSKDKKKWAFFLKVEVKVMLTVKVNRRRFQIPDPFLKAAIRFFLTAIPPPLLPPLSQSSTHPNAVEDSHARARVLNAPWHCSTVFRRGMLTSPKRVAWFTVQECRVSRCTCTCACVCACACVRACMCACVCARARSLHARMHA